MKVRNDSGVEISDVEIKDIVERNVRINLFNRTTQIRVYSDYSIILSIDAGTEDDELVNVGKLNKKMRWDLGD